MFNMSDLSIELLSIEKSYTFPFKDISRLSSTKSIRNTSQTKLSWKINILTVGFKFKYFFSINKQMAIISIIM